MANTTVRILGSTVSESDYFIDFKVSNISVDGIVTLTEKTEQNPRERTMTIQELSELREDNVATTYDELTTDPNHNVWKVLEDLYQMREEPPVENITDEVGQNAEGLFQTVIEANTP